MSVAEDADTWFRVEDVEDVPSPSLLIYRERVENNLRKMIRIAGGTDRLRPHIKTHKMRALIERQLALGITRFKCATLAEAGMAASAGAPDLLLAYQPVGPAARQLAELVIAFPRTKFSVVADDEGALRGLSRTCAEIFKANSPVERRHVEVLLDVDTGQHRTGVPAGPIAIALYRLLGSLACLKPGGLHAYDGHIGHTDLAERTAACEAAFAPAVALQNELLGEGLPVPRVVAGGSPTFPIHAGRSGVECSPGTCVFWDAGYAEKLPDLEFEPAALVLTRVVSKPGGNRVCLDLGHKAVASEMPQPRAVVLGIEDARLVMHSEEHLVIETGLASQLRVGDPLYALPWHICPTIALHSRATVIEGGKPTGTWEITRHRETAV